MEIVRHRRRNLHCFVDFKRLSTCWLQHESFPLAKKREISAAVRDPAGLQTELVRNSCSFYRHIRYGRTGRGKRSSASWILYDFTRRWGDPSLGPVSSTDPTELSRLCQSGHWTGCTSRRFFWTCTCFLFHNSNEFDCQLAC